MCIRDSQYLDSVLDLVERTSGWDDDARFRWNVEVNWPLERWFASRGARDRRRMIDAANAGHVGISAMSLNMHTEACAIEELYEMVRYAVELRAEHGLAVTTAMQTDVPGGVSGLVEVLADVGVTFLSVAHNYAGRFLQFLARDVPGLGYARFNVVEGAPAPVGVSRPGDAVVENEFYRITYAAADASIASVLELATGRELVNTRALLGFNAYVFDRYGTATKVDHLSGRVFSRALDLIADRVTAESAVIVRREASDLGQSMTLDVRAPACSRLLTTITAWRGVPPVSYTHLDVYKRQVML